MPEITRRATFYASRKGGPRTFHLETDGAIVNVTVGLTDSQERQITRVDISPDDETRGGDGEGRIWHQAPGDARIIREHEGEHGPDYAARTAVRQLADRIRGHVRSGVTPAHSASSDLTSAALALGYQVSDRTAAHLLIDPTADLHATETTGELFRVDLIVPEGV